MNKPLISLALSLAFVCLALLPACNPDDSERASQPPVVAAALQDLVLNEGFGSQGIDLSPVFSDPDGDALSYTVESSDVAVLEVQLQGTNLIIQEVAPGSGIITVTARDGFRGTVSDVFTVTIIEANTLPRVANALADLSLEEGFETRTVAISSVFADEDEDALQFTASSSVPAVATVAIAGMNLIITEVEPGNTTISLQASDGRGELVSDEFILTIVNVNDTPVVANPLPDLSRDEGFGTETIDVATVFSDADNDALSLTVSSANEAVVTVSLSGALLTITEQDPGTSVITLMADDGLGGRAEETFTMTVVDLPNVAPVVSNPLPDLDRDEGFVAEVIDASAVFSDANSDVLTITAESSDTLVVITLIDAGTLALTEGVSPGVATITLTAHDGNGGMATDAFELRVANVNDAPRVENALANLTLTLGFGTETVDLSTVFTDDDGDDLTLTASSDTPAVATVSVTGDSLLITEAGAGTAIITVTADDGNEAMTTTGFQLTVTN